MAPAFVNSNIQSGKVVVFINPTCPYWLLEFVNITANGDTNEIQDYLQQLTGCIGGYTDLVNIHERGELLTSIKQIRALQ
ncbi:hypothetical protein JEQ12_005652 [Ovis aries]|uniref:Uncharacterized protein n=1 Tax=Ovis aries TaxID=9940 RepID=A0A836CZL8_SHEEP|nr:hypothetical protein JEQ12_005652 [Ovis aries]